MSRSGQEVMVSMAKASLLGLLAWVLPVQLTGTCLRCWPDAAVYFGYDVYLLLGQDSEATDKLGKLFLGKAGDRVSNSRQFLGTEFREEKGQATFPPMLSVKLLRTRKRLYLRIQYVATSSSIPCF